MKARGRRGPAMTGRQSEFVMSLFREGRSLDQVRAATGAKWADGTYLKLRDIAARGERGVRC
ncbi:hypothetical protein [Sphingomonas colocasiae]|uniref:Recombinase domain-containing protein n=1 Tax=Sphingomonas colocasiae TaxID=1848973 RepID=A0ABS7PXN9_9SPHN|nr:hypothetical protein [Sphingomonas colocasiae]MBY8825107.1 hypothetical protein [Sphingomonas colocasiae]